MLVDFGSPRPGSAIPPRGSIAYPDLTREMAMKIGGEYSSDRVSKTNFEQLAEDAGLAKPLVRSRVPELAEVVLSNLDKTGIEHPVVDTLTVQIRERCGAIRERFGK